MDSMPKVLAKGYFLYSLRSRNNSISLCQDASIDIMYTVTISNRSNRPVITGHMEATYANLPCNWSIA